LAVKTKKSYHHGDLYSELLSAGRSLLEESGTHNLSLRNLAKTIGVSHNAPYRHFKDKAALMMAIADSGFEDLTAAFHKIVKKYPDDPRKQFKEFGLAYLQLAIKNPETTDLMFGGFTKKEKDWIAQPNQSSHASFQLLVDVIESGQEKGLFKIENPLECAIVAWSSMHGLAILITSGFLHDIASSKNQIKQLGERLTELLLSGIQS
jgi:AcrR family transcriptional regulator